MAERNLPLFIAFRTLFNGRFYYPIFSILFLDYGLTLEQFAILNAVWAATSIVLEVPSGAMADVLGRKRLLVFAAVAMVLEMAVIAFVPLGNAGLIFWAFLLNRVLSGIAEAMASGADEALAYDSLPDTPEREARWAGVLERTMRTQSAFFVVAGLVGASVYDASFLNRVLGWLGADFTVQAEQAIRFPIYLTLLVALAVLGVTLAMKELRTGPERPEKERLPTLWKRAFAQTLLAGRWVLATKAVLAILLAGVFLDSVMRLFLTVESQYLRIIGLPEYSFGVVGTVMSAIGIFAPALARRLHLRFTPGVNFALAGLCTFLGLAGCALVLQLYGVIFVGFFMVAFSLSSYFMSTNINRLARPEQRATILSFRGLLINFAYAVTTLAFGGVMSVLQPRVRASESAAGYTGKELERFVENEALRTFMQWYPLYFIVAALAVSSIYIWLRRGVAEEEGDALSKPG